MLVVIQFAFDVHLQLQPRGVIDARKAHNLNFPARPQFNRYAREVFVDSALHTREKIVALDRAVEREPDFQRLLFAAKNLPERLVQQTSVQILPRQFQRRFSVVIAPGRERKTLPKRRRLPSPLGPKRAARSDREGPHRSRPTIRSL